MQKSVNVYEVFDSNCFGVARYPVNEGKWSTVELLFNCVSYCFTAEKANMFGLIKLRCNIKPSRTQCPKESHKVQFEFQFELWPGQQSVYMQLMRWLNFFFGLLRFPGISGDMLTALWLGPVTSWSVYWLPGNWSRSRNSLAHNPP